MADVARRLRIAIIAPVNTSQFNDLLLKAVQPVLPPDVDVSVHNLDQGHDCIQNRTDWLENGFPVVKLAKVLQDQGFDGIWLSDFDMCGVEAAREVIDIPIIGGFPTSVFTALGLSQRFGILTILPSTLAMQQGHVLTHGQQDNADIDLRFSTLMDDLGLPRREAHDALNDAVMAALAFIKLRQLHGAG